MDIYFQLIYWAFQPQVWIIIGIAFILLEIADGSLIFFLPMGMSAQIVALIIYLVNSRILPYEAIPDAWYWLLVYWMVIAVFVTFLLSQIRKYKKINSSGGTDDLNDY
ncbi:hypothetical protein N9I90_08040 [Alphaproteobacteria bacterium]|nr:hypothetical protein [Alphaproteobacteria bacterium]